MDPILRTENLSMKFGNFLAVNDVSFKLNSNILQAIIGPNGAGKTTFFNLISNYLRATKGSVFFKGINITNLPAHEVSLMGMVRSFQISNVFPGLSVFENLRVSAQSRGKDNFKMLKHYKTLKKYSEKAEETAKTVNLYDKLYLEARSLTHGDQRKLEIGMLLATDPDLLLLDEPTAGMANEEVPMIIDFIKEIKATQQKTILLIEHKIEMVMSISDYITVMQNGIILAEGTPDEIKNNREVREAYLGRHYE